MAAPCMPFEAAANASLPKGGTPGTMNTTSSVIRPRTVSVSPSAVARIQVAITSRMAASSSCMRASARVDARDLRALEGEVIHEPLGVEDEADHRARYLVGVDGAAGPDGDDGDGGVGANLPAGGA